MSPGAPEGSPLPPPSWPAPSSATSPSWPAPAAPAAPPAAAVGIQSPPAGAWLLLGVALAAVIGALLPWAELSVTQLPGVNARVNGTDGDGRTTLAIGIVIGLAAVLAFMARRLALWAGVMAFVASALLIVVAINNMADIHRIANEPRLLFLQVEIGSGLWLTLVAGIVGIAGAVLLFVRRSS